MKNNFSSVQAVPLVKRIICVITDEKQKARCASAEFYNAMSIERDNKLIIVLGSSAN